jgi:bacterioferritin-associated ferredoxin
MRISDRDIHQAIAWMRAADPHTLITPGKVYRALGKSPDCGGCIRLFVENMRANDKLKVPTGLRLPPVRTGTADEG